MPTLRTTEHGRVYTRPNSRYLWIRFTGRDGREVRCSSGVTDLEQAAKVLAETAKRQKELTFRSAVVDFFEVHSKRLRPKTLKGYKSALRIVDKTFGSKLLSEINRGSLKQYVGQRRRKVTGATIRREISFLSTVMNHAINSMETGMESNPVLQFSRRDLKVNSRTRWLSPAEFQRLLDSCENDMQRSILQLAVQTGMRLGELTALRKSMIDLDKREIRLPGSLTKSKKPRVIPLSPEAHRTLTEVYKTAPDDLVFWFWKASKQVPMQDFRRFFERARTRAGIEDFKFHDLRHTFASWWVQRGGELYALMKILGHSSFSMVQRYAHLDTAGTHRAMSVVFPHSPSTEEKEEPHTDE